MAQINPENIPTPALGRNGLKQLNPVFEFEIEKDSNARFGQKWIETTKKMQKHILKIKFQRPLWAEMD